MPKVEYNNIMFDSELEVDYYKKLMSDDEVITFNYHPKIPIHINKNNKYTPDFLVVYENTVEIVETKGFNQFSYMRDNIIHNYMKELEEEDLRNYVIANGLDEDFIKNKKVVYKKIKYLKSFGFVDWDFKNPNTIANKRKEKINEQEQEIKEFKKYKKDCERYFDYLAKSSAGIKLTKAQTTWLLDFEKQHIPTLKYMNKEE